MTTRYIQNTIIAVLVTDLLAAGFHISVNTNDSWTTELEKSRDMAAILKAIFNEDIDSMDYCLDCFAAPGDKTSVGMVRLIDGNGVTVISDYSTSLEQHVKRANDRADMIDTMGEEAWIEARLNQRTELLLACKLIQNAWYAGRLDTSGLTPEEAATLKDAVISAEAV